MSKYREFENWLPDIAIGVAIIIFGLIIAKDMGLIL